MLKKISKHVVLSVAVLVVMAQLVFTLVQNTGFSFAQTSSIPAAPSGLMQDTSLTTSSSIAVKWTNNSTTADHFNIERKTTTATDWSAPWSTQLTGSSITSYTDTSIASGTYYDYRVQACLSSYGCSDYAYLIGIASLSSSSSIPLAPSGLMLNGTPTTTSIPLKWTDNSNNEDKFTVQRKLSSASWSSFVPDSTNSFTIWTANTTSYIDTSVTAGTAYDYRVMACLTGVGCSDSAYASAINSASIIECSATISVNSATPSARSVSQSESGVSLVKFNVFSNCAITLNSFAVSLLPMPNGYLNISSLRLYKDGTQIGSTLNNPVAGANFSGLNLAIGAGQTIVLEAKGDISSSAVVGSTVYGVFGGSSATSSSGSVGNNASGNIFAGNTMTIAAGTGDTISPSVPTVLVATKDNYNEVDLSWTASTDNVGVAGYEVWRTNGTWAKLGSSSTTTYIDTTVASGTGYYYKIIAYDAAGNRSLASSELFLNTPAASSTSTVTPVSPSYVTASSATGKIIVSWPASAASYSIYRSVNGGGYSYLIDTTTLEYNDFNVVSGSVYRYKVLGCDASHTCLLAGTESNSVTYTSTATSSPSPTYSPVTTTPVPTPFITPYITAWIDSVFSTNYSFPTLISGIKSASITSNVSFPTGSLNFYVYKYSSAGVVDTSVNYYAATGGNIVLASGSQGTKWTGTINTANLPNAFYKFFAQGYVNTTIGTTSTETAYTSNYVYFKVDNSAVVSPSPAVTPATPTITTGIESSVSGSVVSGAKTLWANSTVPLTGGVSFSFYNTATNTFSAYIVTGYPSKTTAPDAFGNYNYWLGNLDTAKLTNGTYKLMAKAIYNTKPYENTVGYYFNVNNPVMSPAPAASSVPVASFSPLPGVTPTINPNLPPLPVASLYPVMTPDMSYYPPECQQKGYTTPESCKNYMQFPPECRNANILDGIKCQEYMFKNAMPEICRQKGATTQEECSKIIFVNSMPQECKDANITDEAGCMNFIKTRTFLTQECRDANISDFSACGTYMAEKFMPKECVDAGAKTKEDCDYIMRTKYGNFVQGMIPEANMVIPPPGIGGVPRECQDQNVTDPAGCEKIMTAKYMPEDCKAANIATKEDCEKFLFEKNAPRECIKAKIFNPRDCESYIFKMNAPQDCVDAGMLSPEGCKKFMFEKYGDQKNIPLDKFPIECQKAGVKTVDECEKVMTQSYLPEDCRKNGISEPDKCDSYLKQKYMPEECRQAGANTQKECDSVMFKKYAPDECKKAGIENDKECKDYIFNLYAPKATCQGLDELQCKNAIRENYLGAITSKQTEYTKVRDEIVPLAGGDAVKVEDLRKKIGDGDEIIPIKDKDASLKIVKTKEDLVLNEDKDLVQTAGAAVMVDSDNDGLPDDMEKRISTDPMNPDTDKDGIKDGEEVKSGYNPLGEEKMPEDMKEKITPIDEAILGDQTLSHPKTTGTESDSYSFDKISNIEAGQDSIASGKYLFQGKADSDSVVTLYIYSDLPIVVTVKTDKYGNWNYEFDKSLMDGGHEAYVALNDNAGRVVTRSAVMSFFVSEAKAVSVMDFISPASAAAAPVKESEKSMTNYAFMTMAVIFVGIIIFIGLIIVLRRRSSRLPKA